MRSPGWVGIALFLAPVAAGCQATPVDFPWDRADSVATIHNRSVRLRVYAWRDFMPRIGGGPRGTELMVNLQLVAADSGAAVAGLRVDSAWVRSTEGLWRTAPTEEPRPALPDGTDLMLRGGPRWATDQPIDVLVRVVDASGARHYLQGRQQMIGRTN